MFSQYYCFLFQDAAAMTTTPTNKEYNKSVSESAVETTLLQSKVGSGDEVNGDNKIEHEQS